jgi:two-component system response regulator DctR
MQPLIDGLIFIVDDDASVREALAWLLRSRRLASEHFASAEAFEQFLDQGLLPSMPVIFLTGHADVPTAVDAVKRGAFDFCEKPFSDNALVDRIEHALNASLQALEVQRVRRGLAERIGELTDRERDVMRLVVEGLPNKLIADQLAISVRTVEVHRARVFDKMEVKSAVELANRLRDL